MSVDESATKAARFKDGSTCADGSNAADVVVPSRLRFNDASEHAATNEL
jgi:hypothetical protein